MHGRCSMPTGKTAGRRRGAHHQKKKSGNPWDGLERITKDLFSVSRDERQVHYIHYIHYIHYTCRAPGTKKTLEEVLRGQRLQGIVEPSMLFAAGLSCDTSAWRFFLRCFWICSTVTPSGTEQAEVAGWMDFRWMDFRDRALRFLCPKNAFPRQGRYIHVHYYGMHLGYDGVGTQ